MKRSLIHIALLLPDTTVAAWQALMIEKIAALDGCRLALAVIYPEPAQSAPWAYRCYRAVDRRLFLQQPDADLPVDIGSLLPPDRISLAEDTLATTQMTERFASLSIDMLINLSTLDVAPEAAELLTLGIWRCFSGQSAAEQGSPGFWEIYHKEAVICSTLELGHHRHPEGLLLHRAYGRAHPFSAIYSTQLACWKMASFIPRKLAEAMAIGVEAFLEKAVALNISPRFQDGQASTMPSTGTAARLALRQAPRMAATAIDDALRETQWMLLFALGQPPYPHFHQYRPMQPPRRTSWADPHVLAEGDHYYIFIEEFTLPQTKAHLSVITMDRKGKYGAAQKILEKDYHLSYPFIFRHEGRLYMVPETRRNNRIDLYECREFPHGWQFKMTLIDNVAAVDTNLVYQQDRWWLFTSIAENDGGSTHDELFLFSSQELFSQEWIPHPANPIAADIRNCRAAGKPFFHQGSLFRPAMDSSVGYGGAWNLNRIETLDTQQYRESLQGRYTAHWDKQIQGFHTLNFDGDLTVIDANIRKLKWR